MPRASSTTTAKKTTTSTSTRKKVTEPAKETVVRIEGDLYINDKGQVFRQDSAGLMLLYSPFPAQNIHPRQYDSEQYEEKIKETFGEVTKLWPL